MKSAILMMSSVTEANKAKYHLEKLRIKSVVEKITSRRSGCGYGIRVYEEPEKICRLLSLSNIFCKEIRRESESF